MKEIKPLNFYLKIELRYIEQNVKHQYSQIYRHRGGIGMPCEIIICKDDFVPSKRNYMRPQVYEWLASIPIPYIIEEYVAY